MTVCYNNYFVIFSGVTSILKETPTKNELFNLLYDISDKWYDIGLSLQVYRNVLDDLKESKDNEPTKLEKVISISIDTKPSSTTWKKIITAAESPVINNKEIADKIRQYLSRGKSNNLLVMWLLIVVLRLLL